MVNYNDPTNAYDDTSENHTYSNNSLFSNASIGTKAGDFSLDKWIASLGGNSSQDFYFITSFDGGRPYEGSGFNNSFFKPGFDNIYFANCL